MRDQIRFLFQLMLIFCAAKVARCFRAQVKQKRVPPNLVLSTSSTSTNFMESVSKKVGKKALKHVKRLGGFVSMDSNVGGTGGTVFEGTSLEQITGKVQESKAQQVWAALATLERDMQFLDMLAGQKPQLSVLELTLLSGAVLSAAIGPVILGGHITEFLAPSAAAFTAAIGIGAEYSGKVAVADGKEIAAAAIQCAAEAEGLLANAERAKAIVPLCVGVGALCATLALLVPVLLDTLGISSNLQLVTEIYLFCPIVSVLSGAVASLAYQETVSYANQAIGIGNRRFARSGMIGRTWLSTTELVERKSSGAGTKWKSFAISVLPAPLFGSLVPGALPTKTIVIVALAAAQSAYFLTLAEGVLSRASDAVALKSRSAAVCDTYANQGARSAAILPFTSALASLCAAATAALVELPFLETLAEMGTVASVFGQIVAVSMFPTLSALFSAAASVSKARCKVDAEAAKQAACTLALQYNEGEEDPVLRPFRGVQELIRLSIANSVIEPLRRFLKRINPRRRWRRFRLRLRRIKLFNFGS